MHISLEATERHTIQAYSENAIQIHAVIYQKSLIVSKDLLITDLEIHTLDQIDEDFIQLITQHHPKIIIIGHNGNACTATMARIHALLQQKSGIEFMALGAACRTYNVLLSENREVVAGFVF